MRRRCLDSEAKMSAADLAAAGEGALPSTPLHFTADQGLLQ